MASSRNIAVRLLISARDEASSVFGSLQAKVAAVATAITGYFGIRLFGDAISSAADFEAAMSRVRAASGASGAELAALQVAAEAAGATTKYTSTEAAAALENLAKSGLNATQAVQALPAVLNLAQAGGVELGTAAEYITKAVAGMGLSFAEAGRVADVLAMGANASNTSVDGLAQALSYAAPLANSLGLSLEQTVATIGKFADAGIDASRAGTALNSILAQFADPASKFRQELASAGIITGDFNLALRQLAAKGSEGKKAINAVGQEAGPALRALLNQGIGALDDLTGKLKHAEGSAAATAGVMGGNLKGALSGLSSAWDSVRRALAEPLLEPLAVQVSALSVRFREAVADGTVGKFGAAIRTAFEAAAQWVRHFLTTVDFTEVAARLQAFATRAGEVFDAVGKHATTAGGVLQTAYGVMSAGANMVMAAVFKIAEAFSGVASNILSGVALINDGLAKVTFGSVSAGFRQAAADIRQEAGAMWAVSEEFAAKSAAAFDAAASGAQTAANGWKTLTDSADQAAPSLTAAGDALATVGAQATAAAAELTALGTAAAESGAAQQQAATDAQTKLAELRAEYDRLKAAGDTQGMAEKLREIDRLLGGVGSAARASSEDVAAAFERMGITSEAALKQAAQNALRDFEIIRNSGLATPRDIQSAFVAYAEKAIAANGGIADAVLRGQAAINGVRIAADEAGRAVVSAMSQGKAATDALGEAAKETAAKFGEIGAAAEEAADSAQAAANAAASAASGTSGSGGRSASMGDSFTEAMRRGLISDPLAGDDFRQAFSALWNERLNRPSRGGAVNINAMYTQVLEEAAKVVKRSAAAAESRDSRAPASAASVAPAPSSVVRVEIRGVDGRLTRVDTVSAGDAQALVGVIRQLEDAMARASV